jgi:outer membrane lipoprotein-sorting protein
MSKTGYSASFGKSTNHYHEIILTPTTKKGGAKKIVLRLAKSSLQPTYVSMTASDGNVVNINVTSFKSGAKFGDSTFRFNPKSYPDVEVVDLR